MQIRRQKENSTSGKKRSLLAKEWLAQPARVPQVGFRMSIKRILGPKEGCCRSIASDQGSARASTSARTQSAGSSRILRFRRCDLRGVTRCFVRTRAAVRESIRSLQTDEGLFVITYSRPRALVGELGHEGFAVRLEPGHNGDWFVWLWRPIE